MTMSRTRLFTFFVAATVALTFTTTGARAEMGERVATDGFSLQLPVGFSEFAKQTQKVDTPSGPVNQVTYVSKTPAGQACIVTYGEMSGPILDPKAMMVSGRDSILKSLNANLESEKEFDAAGKKAMSFSFSAAEPRPIFARTDMIVDGPRMYQVIYLGFTPDDRASHDVDALFSSFQLTAK